MIKEFYLGSCDIDKFLYQNGCDEAVDSFEGCLLDNVLYFNKNGAIIAIYEHYLNSNSSDYRVVVARDKDSIDKVWSDFANTMNEYEEAYA